MSDGGCRRLSEYRGCHVKSSKSIAVRTLNIGLGNRSVVDLASIPINSHS
jgi:hypothetical protein